MNRILRRYVAMDVWTTSPRGLDTQSTVDSVVICSWKTEGGPFELLATAGRSFHPVSKDA